MTYDLIIFDCDGVLVDSERLANGVVRDLLNEQGANASIDAVIAAFKGKSLAQHQQIAQDSFGITFDDDFAEIYHTRLFDKFRRELKVIAGIPALIDSLQVPYCVASNSGRERVELCLNITGLKPRFGERIFTVDDVERGKPAPDIFLLAARTMGVPVEKCLVIEDSLSGVQAARNALMTVFGFADLTPASDLKTAGARVFNSMAEIQSALAQGTD